MTVLASRSTRRVGFWSAVLATVFSLAYSIAQIGEWLGVAAIHEAAPPERRVWSLVAFGFAVIYAALISINYYVQLAWVGPRLAAGEIDGMEPFLFVPFDSFLYAVDILGYSFMSLATLAASRVFIGGGQERWVRWFLVANGFVLPFLLFQMYVHWLIWIAASWAVTFPGSTWSLAVLFKRLQPMGERA